MAELIKVLLEQKDLLTIILIFIAVALWVMIKFGGQVILAILNKNRQPNESQTAINNMKKDLDINEIKRELNDIKLSVKILMQKYDTHNDDAKEHNEDTKELAGIVRELAAQLEKLANTFKNLISK